MSSLSPRSFLGCGSSSGSSCWGSAASAGISKGAIISTYGPTAGKGLYKIIKAAAAAKQGNQGAEPTNAEVTADTVNQVWAANEQEGATRLKKALDFTRKAADHPFYYLVIVGFCGFYICSVATANFDKMSEEEKNKVILTGVGFVLVGLQAVSNGVRRVCGWFKKSLNSTAEESANNQKALLFYYVLSNALYLYTVNHDPQQLIDHLGKLDDALNEESMSVWRHSLSPEILKGIGVVELLLKQASASNPENIEEFSDPDARDQMAYELAQQQFQSDVEKVFNYLNDDFFPKITTSLGNKYPNFGKDGYKIIIQKPDGTFWDLSGNQINREVTE